MIYASWEDEPDEAVRRLGTLARQFHGLDTWERLHYIYMAGHGALWGPRLPEAVISALRAS